LIIQKYNVMCAICYVKASLKTAVAKTIMSYMNNLNHYMGLNIVMTIVYRQFNVWSQFPVSSIHKLSVKLKHRKQIVLSFPCSFGNFMRLAYITNMPQRRTYP